MERVCKSCKHYIQHYIRWHKRKRRFVYTDVYCGHCRKRRFKDCTPDRKACEDWEKA